MKDFLNQRILVKWSRKSDSPKRQGKSAAGLYLDDSQVDLSAALETHNPTYLQDVYDPYSQTDTYLQPDTDLQPDNYLQSEAASSDLEVAVIEARLKQLIGQRLSEAGLLVPGKLQLVLEDQKRQPDLLFGEILLLRGWIQENTLDFFLNLEVKVYCAKFHSLPLGERLQQAGLVSEENIQRALQEQKRLCGKLGQILALQGVVNQITSDYFARL